METSTVELVGRVYENAEALKTRLGISEFAIRTYLKHGMPRPIKIGGRRFYDKEKVEEWFVANQEV